MKLYGLDPMWKRIGWYGIALAMGTALILMYLGKLNPEASRQGLCVLGLSIIALACVQAVILHAVRVRVDEDGLSRRVWLWWDCWSWDAFHSGRIQYIAERGAFRDPAKPPWRQEFSLAFLGKNDRDAILAVCTHHWSPSPVEHAESITLTFRSCFLGTIRLRLEADGILLKERGSESIIPWRQVETVWVTKLSRLQTGFSALYLPLSSVDVKLRCRREELRTRRNWRGPASEVILSFLQRHLSPEKIRSGHLSDPAETSDDLILRIAQARHQFRKFRRILPFMVLFVVLIFPAFTWMCCYEPRKPGQLMAAAAWILPFVVATSVLEGVCKGPMPWGGVTFCS